MLSIFAVPALTKLGDARSRLLEKAARRPDDVHGLLVACESYREAIVELRTKIAGLEVELGAEQAQRLVGTMMYHTMSASQRVLIREIYADLHRDDQPSATPPVEDSTIDRGTHEPAISAAKRD